MNTKFLELGVRAERVLKELDIKNIEELALPETWERLKKYEGCGYKTIYQIMDTMLEHIRGDVLKQALEHNEFKENEFEHPGIYSEKIKETRKYVRKIENAITHISFILKA